MGVRHRCVDLSEVRRRSLCNCWHRDQAVIDKILESPLCVRLGHFRVIHASPRECPFLAEALVPKNTTKVRYREIAWSWRNEILKSLNLPERSLENSPKQSFTDQRLMAPTDPKEALRIEYLRAAMCRSLPLSI